MSDNKVRKISEEFGCCGETTEEGRERLMEALRSSDIDIEAMADRHEARLRRLTELSQEFEA